jgi:hypothetical protein
VNATGRDFFQGTSPGTRDLALLADLHVHQPLTHIPFSNAAKVETLSVNAADQQRGLVAMERLR